MKDLLALRQFLLEDQASIPTEYVIFVAAAGTLLVVGVAVLFRAMSGFFNDWAAYFRSGS
jgi:Flp pilus assembly pilin Flp